MMFCAIEVYTFCIFVISVTSKQLQARESGNGELNGGYSSRRELESSYRLCSEVGNCTCLFEGHRVTVKCTSVRNNFDEIASKLPTTTTQL